MFGEDDRDHHKRDQDQGERADHVARCRLLGWYAPRSLSSQTAPTRIAQRAPIDARRALRSLLRAAPWKRRRMLARHCDLGSPGHCFLMESIETIARNNGPRGEVVLRRRLGAGRSVEELIINGAFAMDSSDSSHGIACWASSQLPSGRARRVAGRRAWAWATPSPRSRPSKRRPRSMSSRSSSA